MSDSIQHLPQNFITCWKQCRGEISELLHLAVFSFLFLPEWTHHSQVFQKQKPDWSQADSCKAAPPPLPVNWPLLPGSWGDAASRAAPDAEFCGVLLCNLVTHWEHRSAELISVLNLPLRFIFSKLFINSIAQLFHINLFHLANFSSTRGSFSLFLLLLLLSQVQETGGWLEQLLKISLKSD